MLNKTQQKGFVSILVVIFFMLLGSVLALSFTKLVNQAQQNTLADQQSKLAYQAALAGVEDAKRALLYCDNNPSAAGCDDPELYNANCPGFFDGGFTALGISQGAGAMGEAVQVGAEELNQRYSCVVIDNTSETIFNTLTPHTSNDSDFVRMRAVSQFNEVKIAWGETNSGLTLPSSSDVIDDNLLDDHSSSSAAAWHGNWPAMLRVTKISHAKNNMEIGPDTSLTSEHYFLIPSSGGNTVLNAAREQIQCDLTDGDGDGYICAATMPVSDTSSIDYSLKLTAYYAQTDYEISLQDSAGDAVEFMDVRPTVDSTGAVGNVYRRVEAQVSLTPASLSGSVALDIGQGLCKDFSVAESVSSFSRSCGP